MTLDLIGEYIEFGNIDGFYQVFMENAINILGATDTENNTFWHMLASRSGNLSDDNVERLFEKLAEIDEYLHVFGETLTYDDRANASGLTPLMLSFNNLYFANKLIERYYRDMGPFIRDSDRKNVLHHLMSHIEPELPVDDMTLDLIDNVVTMIIDSGENINDYFSQRDVDGQTPLDLLPFYLADDDRLDALILSYGIDLPSSLSTLDASHWRRPRGESRGERLGQRELRASPLHDTLRERALKERAVKSHVLQPKELAKYGETTQKLLLLLGTDTETIDEIVKDIKTALHLESASNSELEESLTNFFLNKTVKADSPYFCRNPRSIYDLETILYLQDDDDLIVDSSNFCYTGEELKQDYVRRGTRLFRNPENQYFSSLKAKHFGKNVGAYDVSSNESLASAIDRLTGGT